MEGGQTECGWPSCVEKSKRSSITCLLRAPGANQSNRLEEFKQNISNIQLIKCVISLFTEICIYAKIHSFYCSLVWCWFMYIFRFSFGFVSLQTWVIPDTHMRQVEYQKKPAAS